MARKMSDAADILSDVVEREGWSKRKQIEVLISFIEAQELEVELEAYLDERTAPVEDDEDDELFEPDAD